MKKMRYGAMAVTIALGVGAFLGAQWLELLPGPWTKKPSASAYIGGGLRGIEVYSAAIADSPGDYMTYYRRATVLQKQQKYEQALADLDAAVKLSPTPVSLEVLGARANDTTAPETHTLNLVVLVRTTRAEILQQLNRPEEALADLDQAHALDARKTAILYQRGLLRLITARYDDAIVDFSDLFNHAQNSQLHFMRGLAKYLKSDWTAAIADFQYAAQHEPSDAHLIWLAKAYLRAGAPMPQEPFAAMDAQGNARHVIEAFMSDHDADQFISGVRAGASYVGQDSRGNQCEAALFLGEWLVLRKKGMGAQSLLSEALTNCAPLSIERAIATAELARLTP